MPIHMTTMPAGSMDRWGRYLVRGRFRLTKASTMGILKDMPRPSPITLAYTPPSGPVPSFRGTDVALRRATSLVGNFSVPCLPKEKVGRCSSEALGEKRCFHSAVKVYSW